MTAIDGAVGPPGARIGIGARVVGVIGAPGATFARIAADPRWIQVLALNVLGIAGLSAALLQAPFAQRALLEQQIGSIEAFGVTVTDEMYTQMAQQVQFAAYATFVSIVVAVPVLTLGLAGVLHGVGAGLLGAPADFRQLFAVVVHSGVISLLQQLFVVPLNYARESITPPATLAAFAPTLDDASFGYALLSSIDLFQVWWVAVLAIGLSVIWRRPVRGIAAGLFTAYGGIVLAVAAIRTSLGG